MVKKGRIFVLLLLIFVYTASEAVTSNRIESSAEKNTQAEEELKQAQSLGFLDAEISKDITQKKAQNSYKPNVSKIDTKESPITKLKSYQIPPKRPTVTTSNLTSKKNFSSSATDWSPILNKTPTNESIARIEKEEKKAGQLVNNLMNLNYNNYVPPRQLYNASAEEDNKHIPAIYFKSDYFNMAFQAIKKGDIEGLRSIITQTNFINKQNKDGDTLLIFAIANNKLNSARLLLAKGACPNITNYQQRSPLHYAAFSGNVEATKLLLSMGAKADIMDSTRTTPIDYAKLENQQNIIDILNKYLEQSQ